jgi:hypothetical protein
VISVVRAESVTRSSAVIRWTTNEAATGRVEYWTTGAATRTPTVTTLSTQHKIQLRYLRKATRYSYRVRSRDVSGVTATSAVKTFTTPR